MSLTREWDAFNQYLHYTTVYQTNTQRESETDRERERDRQTDRQRQTDKQTETDRPTDRQTKRLTASLQKKTFEYPTRDQSSLGPKELSH